MIGTPLRSACLLLRLACSSHFLVLLWRFHPFALLPFASSGDPINLTRLPIISAIYYLVVYQHGATGKNTRDLSLTDLQGKGGRCLDKHILLHLQKRQYSDSFDGAAVNSKCWDLLGCFSSTSLCTYLSPQRFLPSSSPLDILTWRHLSSAAEETNAV